MKKLTALVLVSFLAAVSARATLFWYDGFQYSNGPVIVTSITPPPTGPTGTNSLWVRESGTAASSDMYCVNSNLQVCATGGSLISRQDDCFRLFVQTNWALANGGLPGGSGNYGSWTNNLSQPAQKIYASFTVICATSITNYTNTLDSVVNSNTPVINGVGLPNGAGSYFASFYNTFYGYCGRVQAFTNGTVLPNTWRLGVTDNVLATNLANGGFPVDLAVNTPYQVVEEFDPNHNGLQAATIWVNPININQTGISPVDPKYTASDLSNAALTNALNAYSFRQASSFGNATFLITNLAVATTFAEAMTNIWTTNARPPVIVYQPTAVISNFVGAAFKVSAVANGQGLGSLIYKWQVSATPDNASPSDITSGDLSGTTANVLSFDYADTPDSGYYTLVATTPYGLSATSSVAKVVISAALVPPSFVSQPVSQTAYTGQTATFSTTVVSPGDVYFTWYSNNVIVTAGQVDNGDSSSYVLNNVQTSFSGAMFKVAVTNDYANYPTNGIVSTNAVLTVLNPQQVTIAYLRSLVDPTSFAPTNSPPSIPYQVTGTVTTYTNTTTGNTSSYYLQDGTAGINIFVTGGSTFRPIQGDVVTFVGVLSSYTSGLELYADSADNNYPYTSYIDTGTTNALPAPVAIPYNFTNAYGFLYVNTNLAGRLVQLTDVHFGTNAGTILSASANQNFIVTNSSGQQATLSFFDLDLNTVGQTLPAYASSVTGVVYGFQPTFSVMVTRFGDINTNMPSADVGITKTGPGAVVAGGTITYTITITNSGPGSASGVIATDSLPPGVTFVSASDSGTDNGGVITWNLGDLPVGGTTNLTVTVTAPTNAVTLTNSASVGSTTPDPNLGNNFAQASTPVKVLVPQISVIGGNVTIQVASDIPIRVWYTTNVIGPFYPIVTNPPRPYTDTDAWRLAQPAGFYKISSP
jgi:uncharacterized repeat protein (TIGR01451 family)